MDEFINNTINDGNVINVYNTTPHRHTISMTKTQSSENNLLSTINSMGDVYENSEEYITTFKKT